MLIGKRYRKKTRIVATLGPASSTKTIVTALYKNGADVFRINFSHGDHVQHKKIIKMIREIESKEGRPIAILADIQGPKFRIGTFEQGQISLKKGQSFIFDRDKKPGDQTRVHLPHQEVIEEIQPGDMILLDDGKVRMVVTKKTEKKIVCEVLNGEALSDKKGFNLPNTCLSISILTPKDKKDIAFALEQGVDWLALSFVQSARDIVKARNFIKKHINNRPSVALLAKIEKPSAVREIDNILLEADGVMVARGDLGVEMPPEEVPTVQKRIIKIAREIGKPVIVATQMLESMITQATPTRAEASDVATAVYESSDAVMLSAETAAGQYPVQAVKMMSRIIGNVEQDSEYRYMRKKERMDTDNTISDSITYAARAVSYHLSTALIINYTTSGSTTLRTSRMRPAMPILALASTKEVARQLVLSYGVYPVVADDLKDFDQIIEYATSQALEEGLVHKGDRVVITAGVPFGVAGTTNTLRVSKV